MPAITIIPKVAMFLALELKKIVGVLVRRIALIFAFVFKVLE